MASQDWIDAHCLHCGGLVRASAQEAGRTCACSECGHQVRIPRAPGESEYTVQEHMIDGILVRSISRDLGTDSEYHRAVMRQRCEGCGSSWWVEHNPMTPRRITCGRCAEQARRAKKKEVEETVARALAGAEPFIDVERLLRERAGLITVLLLAAAGGCAVLALFGKGQGAGVMLCPGSIFALSALLPGWFLLMRRFGEKALVCSNCNKPVTRRGEPHPAWFDADEVDYRCCLCNTLLCGKCATSTSAGSVSLQSLKAKYKAGGAALKRAINADPQARYEKGELDPICPKCKHSLFKVGKVL